MPSPSQTRAPVNRPPTARRRVKPEVMSPVGGWPQLHAAVEAGADAVFFGLDHSFQARAKVGFSAEELPEIMRALHVRGVKGFVTFNTLVFDRELREAETQLMHIAASGADAIIVQDWGAAQLAQRVCPDLPIHGSTQMSVTSAEGAELARRFGAVRVVLGRELSLQDIGRIAAATDLELETFVHGALCVSYSGQCFSSEAWGGRSANRGQCAQACRLPYDLLVDGVQKDLGDARYLLSPGDLYALHQVPELMVLGVSCLKIEGRYKDAEYVALTTAAYRQAVDEAWEGLPLSVTPQQEQDIAQVYSRGLAPHFMAGTNHQTVVRGRAPRHRGLKVGVVTEVTQKGVRVLLEGIPVHPGDGLVFDAADWQGPFEKEEGGFLYEIFTRQGRAEEASGGEVELRFGQNAVKGRRIAPGDWVWRTSDPSLSGRVKPLLGGTDPLHTRPVSAHFVGRLGEVPALTLTDEEGRSVTVQGDSPLSAARNRALDALQLFDQLGKLGGTPYHLAGLSCELVGETFLPVSALNALRREAAAALSELRGLAPAREIQPALNGMLAAVPRPAPAVSARAMPAAPRLHVLVRTPEQLEAATPLRPDSITLDYLELYGLKPSVMRVQEAGIAVRVASPRILKPSEQNIQKFLLGLGAGLLVRSGGLLEGLQGVEGVPELTGDFSLNAANVLSARALLDLNLERLNPGLDLNAAQVRELAGLVGPERIEATVYAHLPVFHTEHCVFCRFLSSGTDHTNCGHPCESHRLALRDHRGQTHPVMADVGCRNTVFEGRAQTAARHLHDWQAAGIRDFRLEFVHEDAAGVRAVLLAFRSFLAGQMSVPELEEALAVVASPDAPQGQGVTEGSLFVPGNFGALPQLELIQG